MVKLRGSDPAPAAVFTVTTGIIGGMFGPFVLTKVRVTDAPARGIALGAISHSIGTSAALTEGETAGALATLAMMSATFVTGSIAPWYIPLLLRVTGH